MSKTLYENEQLISQPSGDYIVLDIAGNKTDGKNVFAEDLAQGETVLKEFNVNLRPPVIRNMFHYYVMCILTVGIYYVYIHYMGCCRPKAINTRRAKLVLTSFGRLGVWYTDVHGREEKGNRGYRTIAAMTKISWFKVADISHMQHYHYVKRITEFFCLKTNQWESSLRIFFGVFPDQALCDAYNLRLAVPKSISMSATLLPNDINVYFSVTGYMTRVAQSAFSAMRILMSTVGLLFLDDSTMLEVFSGNLDEQRTEPEAAFQELLDLQRTLLAAKQPRAVLSSDAQTTSFKIVNERVKLVDDNVAYLEQAKIAMCAGETFLDAFTYEVGWTFMEILATIATCGLYWVAVVRFRHGLKSAIVVSNFRLFEISQDLTPGFCSTGDNFTFVVRSWFLGGLDTGVVAREKFRVWTEMQMEYGALRVEPFIKLGWFESLFTGINETIASRAKRFLMAFSASTTFPAVFQQSAQLPTPAMVSEDFKLMPGEKMVGYIDAGSAFNGCSVAGCQPPVMISSLLSCGKYPMSIFQDLAVTSHRLLASASAQNKPLCMDACLAPNYKFYFWSSLSSRYLIGSQTRGDVTIMENCLTTWCGPCFGCTGATAKSSFSLAYAFNSAAKGFPISIQHGQRNATKGLLESDALNHIRHTLGQNQALQSQRLDQLNQQQHNASAAHHAPFELPPSYGSAPPPAQKSADVKQ